ncbi:MAG: hypothetical protein E6J90_52855 [Deltaproteobacteria bacterium]|nr:MAG: hypothetical protein E6J91_48650 [Deltaproteobacteria bacterium]TMQ03760.1 MAG: hypothetical protein E6J90_52855 [Deltaproteobacteria bacterium]
MRGAALWIVTLIASCAPDYAHSAFRCDAEHGCPTGQACLAGRCRRGELTGDGVGCGSATCGVTEQCCLDPLNLPRCRPAGDVCPGTSVLCDGSEDCRAGDRCCADGDTVFCDATCDRTACRDDGDCPSTEPNCCGATPEAAGACSRPSC